MSNTIFFLFAVSLFFIGMEFIVLGAFRVSRSNQRDKAIQIICRVILGTIIIAYILLMGLFLYVGVDMMLSRKAEQGVSVLVSGAIMEMCVYFWLIRSWIKHIGKMKK